jgi:RNA polymerase sporulation-specific sigma factor
MPLDSAVFHRARSGDQSAREEVFNANTGLVWAAVKRFSGLLEKEDLYQLGAIGLLKAIDRFDPDYGSHFSTFAFPHIMGEIRRFLRDNTPVKVERRLKEVAVLAKKFRTAYRAKHGTEPPVEEVARALELDVDTVVSALDATQAITYLEDVPAYREEAVSFTEDATHVLVESMDLYKALDSLDPKERTILESRFFREKTQSEISKDIGMSQAHVSRLEKKALSVLRSYLQVRGLGFEAAFGGDTTGRGKNDGAGTA